MYVRFGYLGSGNTHIRRRRHVPVNCDRADYSDGIVIASHTKSYPRRSCDVELVSARPNGIFLLNIYAVSELLSSVMVCG